MPAGTLPQLRALASQPEGVVYSGPQAPPSSRVTLQSLTKKYAAQEPITMVTAYDYPSAVHVRPEHDLYTCMWFCRMEMTNAIHSKEQVLVEQPASTLPCIASRALLRLRPVASMLQDS